MLIICTEMALRFISHRTIALMSQLVLETARSFKTKRSRASPSCTLIAKNAAGALLAFTFAP